MSNLIGGAIGAGVGSLAGGTFGWSAATWTQIGWTAGVYAANYFFAPTTEIVNEGPRLNDLKVTSSAYGVDIPKVYGSYRISGNIIWALPLNETRHEEIKEQGKGGGSSTEETNIWYTYDGTWAVALCEGPIAGITKIWFGSVLVYDYSENGDFVDFSQSSGLGQNISIYNGDSDQLPDWVIQSDQPDTPAYRNTCYIVFNEIQLENYANAIPNVTCEVLRDATSISKTLTSGSYLTSTVDPTNVKSLFIGATIHTFEGQWDSATNLTKDYNLYQSPLGKHSATLARTPEVSRNNINWILMDNNTVSYPDTTPIYTPANIFSKELAYVVYYNDTFYGKHHFYIYNEDGRITQSFLNDDEPPENNPYHPGGFGFYINNNELSTKINAFVYDRDLFLVQFHANPRILYSGVRDLTHSGQELLDLIPQTNLTNMYDAWLGSSEIYVLNNNGSNYPTLDIYNKRGVYLRTYTIEPVEPFLFSTVNPEHYTKLYSDADGILHIIDGISGQSTGISLHKVNTVNGDYEFIGTEDNAINSAGSYAVINDIYHVYDPATDNYQVTGFNLLGKGDTTLESSLNELALNCGVELDDLDFTIGTDVINGYVMTRNMSARAAMEPLLSAYDYTIAEEDFKITLQSLQQTSIATIPESELGANSGNLVETNIGLENELLKSLVIKYANPDSDYQTSSQIIRRIDTNAIEEKVVELPLALTDDQGKQLCEKNVYRNWLSRYRYKFNLPVTYNYLVPNNVITITHNGAQISVKLTNITNNLDGYLECNGVADNFELYKSIAKAQSTSGNSAKIREPAGETTLHVLNIPTLKNAYINTEGFYVAGSGQSNGWRGCNVYSRISGTGPLIEDVTLLGNTPSGNAIDVLGEGITHTWDRVNSVIVASYPELTSLDELSLLRGGNHCLLGNEILQFATATDNGNGTFTLSNLLRGRLGTEHTTGTHIAGETFLILSSSTMDFINKDLGNTYEFVASSIGQRVNYAYQETASNGETSGYDGGPYSSPYPFGVNVTPRPDGFYTLAESDGESKTAVYNTPIEVRAGRTAKISYIIPPGVDRFYLANTNVNSWNCGGSSLCYYDHSLEDLKTADDYGIASSTGYTVYFVFDVEDPTVLKSGPTSSEITGFFIIKNDSLYDWQLSNQTISMRISNKGMYNAWINGDFSEGELTQPDTTNAIEVTNTGRNLQPYSPVNVRYQRSGNDILLEWTRRSRYITGYFKSAPIIETSINFTIEVYDSTDALVREITDVTTDSYTYDIATDSFLPADEVRFKIFQISSIVGKGISSEYLIVQGV